MLSWEKPPVKPMALGSLFHHIISLLFTLLLVYYFAIFTFQSIQQKYQKYLSNYLYQISLLRVSVKGLTTPLSCWLQGSWLFVQVRGTCVKPPTLLHHPFLFKEKPTHAQEVATRISGAIAGEIYAKSSQELISRQLAISGAVAGDIYAQVKTYQVPITKSYPSHYIIFHLPLVFLPTLHLCPFL